MRCQFYETPKIKRRIRQSYTRANVRFGVVKHIITAVRCPGTMKVKLTVTHDGGYGACSYDLEIQYYCDTCKKILHGRELPGTIGHVEEIMQRELDLVSDKKYDKLADAVFARDEIIRKMTKGKSWRDFVKRKGR